MEHSDGQVALAIIGMIGTVATALISGLMAYLMAKLNVKQTEAARILATTKSATDRKLDKITAVGNATHGLVNSAMQEQLRLNSELSKWKADSTQDPGDIEAARVATQKYEDHVRAQKTIDAAKMEE